MQHETHFVRTSFSSRATSCGVGGDVGRDVGIGVGGDVGIGVGIDVGIGVAAGVRMDVGADDIGDVRGTCRRAAN